MTYLFNMIITINPDGHLKNLDGVKLLNKFEEFSGKTIELSFKKVSNARTAEQNRYLHGVVLPYLQEALQDSGMELEMMGVKIPPTMELTKLFFKVAFNESKDTSKSTVDELRGAIESCRNYASANLECYIPSAGEADLAY